MKYPIRAADIGDIKPSFELALHVFMEYEAPDYDPELKMKLMEICER